MTDTDAPDRGRTQDPAADVRPAHVLAVLLLGALLIAPIVLIYAPLGPDALRGDPLVVVLSWAVVVYSAVRIAMFCWHARAAWAGAIFWAFSYVWLGLASLAQSATGINPMSVALPGTLQTTQVGMVLVGFVAFDLGRWAVHSRRGDRRGGTPGTDATSAPWVLSVRRVTMLGVVAVLATPLLVVALGGPAALFGSRDAVAAHLEGAALYTASSHVGGGTLTVIANVLPFAPALAILSLWQARPELRRRPVLIGVFACLVVANLILNNPISNARNWIFAIGIAVLLTLWIMRRGSAKVAFISVFIAAATVIFPYADAFRTEQVGVSISNRSTSDPVDSMIGETDYGSITDVGLAVLYVENHGHTWGRQLSGALSFWVPRMWWPGKPANTAELLADEIGFPNRNLDTPLWAEAYIDFGIPGTAVVLGAFGALARRVDDVLEDAETDWRRHAHVAFPIAVSFVGYESFVLRGSLLQAMAKIVALVALLALLGRREPHPATPAPAERPIRTGAVP